MKTASRRNTLQGQEAFAIIYNVFGAVLYGSEKVVRNSFILVSEEENGTKVLWVAKFLLLLKVRA